MENLKVDQNIKYLHFKGSQILKLRVKRLQWNFNNYKILS